MRFFILPLLVLIALANPVFAANYAKVFDALLTSQRSAGVTLSGGKAYFYVPGTDTLKTVYSSRSKTIAANPYTLSADGTAMLYGDGLYDVKITNSAGVQKYLWEDVSLKDASGEFYSLSDYADLPTAITAIGSTPATLIIASHIVLTTAVVIPSTMELMFINGAYVTFTGSGSLTGLRESRPEWFGATGDNVSDDYISLSRAISASRNLILTKTYYSSGKLVFPCDQLGFTVSGINFRGSGIRSGASSDYGFTFEGTYSDGTGIGMGRGITIKDVTLYSTNSTTKGLYIKAVANVYFDKVRLKGFDGGSQLILSQVWDSWFYNCYFDTHAAAAAASTVIDSGTTDSSNNLRFINCTWETITYESVRFTGLTLNNYAILFSGCKFESNPTSSVINTYSGITLGLNLEGCSFYRPGSGGTTVPMIILSAARGVNISNCMWVLQPTATIPYLIGLTNTKEFNLINNNIISVGTLTSMVNTAIGGSNDLYFAKNTTLNVTVIDPFDVGVSAANLSGASISVNKLVSGASKTGTLAIGASGETQLKTHTGLVAQVADGSLALQVMDSIVFTAISSASAGNSSLFRDSADNKLKFKDSGGSVNLLY